MSVEQLPPKQPRAQARDAKLVHYDEYIDTQITSTRRLVKAVDVTTVLLTIAVGTLLFLLATAVVEHWLVTGGFSLLTRTILFASLFSALVYYAARRLWPLVFRPINPVYAAHTIEQGSPSLKNSLLNLLLFREQRDEITDAVYETLEQQAAQRLTRVPVEAAVDRSYLLRLGYVLIAVVLLCALYKIASPKDPLVTAQRVLMPWADIVPASRVTISNIEPGTTTLARGEVLTVAADVQGIGADDPVIVRYTTSDGQAVGKSVQLQPDSAGLRFSGPVPAPTPGAPVGIAQDLRYQIEAGDARSLEYRISVVASPTISVERIEYDYPDYTGFADRQVENLGDIRAIEGTKVTIHARANETIEEAAVDYEADGRRDVPMTVEESLAHARLVLALRDDRQTPTFTSYVLRFTSIDGRKNTDPVKFSVDVVPDYLPEVSITAPREKIRDVRLDETVAIEVEARDPDFALTEVRVESDAAGRKVFDQPLLTSDRTGRFTGRFLFRPSEHHLRAGDVVRYWAAARDNRRPQIEPAKSETLAFRIVSPDPNQQQPPDRVAQRDKPQERQPNDQQQQGDQQGQQQPGGESGEAGQQSGFESSDQQGNQQQGESASADGQSGDQKESGNEQNSGNQSNSDSQSQSGNQSGGQSGEQSQKQQPGNNQSSGSQSGGEQRNQQSGNDQQQQPGGNSRGQSGQRSGEQSQQSSEGGQSSGQSGQQRNLQPSAKNSGTQGGEQQREGSQDGQRSGDPRSNAQQRDQNQRSQGNQKQQGIDSQSQSDEQSPVSPDGDNDGEAFERIQKFLNKQNQGKEQDGSQSQDSGEESGGEDGKSRSDQQDAREGESASADGQTGEKSGAQTRPGDAPNKSQQPPNGEQHDPQTPGGQQTSSKGESGAGDKPQDAQGSPDSQPGMKPGEKWQQKPSGENLGKNQEPPSGGRGKRESDSQGGQGGDRAGGGEEGGGQESNREGTGSSGQNQSADEGAGESSEQGAGNNSQSGGQDATSNERTGQPGSNQRGEGSSQREGQSDQQGGQSGEQHQGGEQGGEDAGEQGGQSGGEKSGGQTAGGEDAPARSESGGEQQGENQNRSERNEGAQQQSGQSSGGPPNGDATGVPQGAGQPPRTDGAAPEADAANLDYARKQTDLVLESLADQLRRKKVDKQMLDELGWSADDLQRFIDRWSQLKESARGDGPNADAARRDLDDALRSLGLRSGPLQQSTAPDDSVRDLRQGYRGPVPLEYQERLRAYNQGVSRARPDDEYDE